MENKAKPTVGILSFYYKNHNCGGLLQAYAMQRVLSRLEYDSRHICLDKDIETPAIKKSILEKFREETEVEGFCLWMKFPCFAVKKICQKSKKILAKRIFLPGFEAERSYFSKAMDRFEAIVPHTKQIYRYSDITDAAEEFDIYLCGSDQIWNPRFADLDIYSLGFVGDDKIKLAYAPSIANKYLTEEQVSRLCRNLRVFSGISLREKDYQQIIADKLGREVSVVLDPTLLLKREDWNDMLLSYHFSEEEAADSAIEGKYLFAYLLGNNAKNRKCIMKYAQKHGLSVVYCPYAAGSSSGHLDDMKFGDRRIRALSPAVFVKLIRNAEFVATDSFHACVFSILFHTPFCALDRTAKSKQLDMSSRLDTLLGSLGLEWRRCRNGEKIREGMETENWISVDRLLMEQREYSMNYLRKALKG